MNVATKFCVEISVSNPNERTGYERGNLLTYEIAKTRKQACELSRLYYRLGYWVEVYDDVTRELLAGPISPDEKLPAYIV